MSDETTERHKSAAACWRHAPDAKSPPTGPKQPQECPSGWWLVSGTPVLARGLRWIAPSLSAAAAEMCSTEDRSQQRPIPVLTRTTKVLQENLGRTRSYCRNTLDMCAKMLYQFQTESFGDPCCWQMMSAVINTRLPLQLTVWRGHLEVLLAFVANGMILVARCRS